MEFLDTREFLLKSLHEDLRKLMTTTFPNATNGYLGYQVYQYSCGCSGYYCYQGYIP